MKTTQGEIVYTVVEGIPHKTRMAAMRFGKLIKTRRLEMNVSLRAFCTELDEDPSNWSKMERGKLPPPESYEKRLQIALYLGYEKGTPEMDAFFELADIERGNIPQDIQKDADAMEKLPLLFRTLRGNPTEAELMRLVDIVRNAHSPRVQK